MKLFLPVLFGLLLSLPSAASAAETGQSPTLEALQDEAQKDPAAQPKSEQAKTDASQAYTGEGFQGVTIQSLTPVDYVDPKADAKEDQEVIQEKPQPSKTANPTYHFEGKSVVKGVTIYTPKEDKPGDDKTQAPERKSLVSPWLVYGALGLGLATTILGIFFPPLLFLGGLGLGVGGLLWYLNKKFS